MPTVEDRIKTYMSEYLLDKERRLNSEYSKSMISLCLWSFLCGAIIAYSSLLPMTIGFALGISFAYKKPELVSYVIEYATSIIGYGNQI